MSSEVNGDTETVEDEGPVANADMDYKDQIKDEPNTPSDEEVHEEKVDIIENPLAYMKESEEPITNGDNPSTIVEEGETPQIEDTLVTIRPRKRLWIPDKSKEDGRPRRNVAIRGKKRLGPGRRGQRAAPGEPRPGPSRGRAAKPRASYPARFKLQVVRHAVQFGKRATARRFNLSETNVRRWMADREELEGASPSRRSFRGQECHYPLLEQQLLELVGIGGRPGASQASRGKKKRNKNSPAFAEEVQIKVEPESLPSEDEEQNTAPEYGANIPNGLADGDNGDGELPLPFQTVLLKQEPLCDDQEETEPTTSQDALSTGDAPDPVPAPDPGDGMLSPSWTFPASLDPPPGVPGSPAAAPPLATAPMVTLRAPPLVVPSVIAGRPPLVLSPATVEKLLAPAAPAGPQAKKETSEARMERIKRLVRKSLTLSEKLQVIRKVEASPSKTRVQVAKELGMPVSTLNGIMGKKFILIAQLDAVSGTVKRRRIGKYEEVEKKLMVWFKQTTALNIRINGNLLREKASEIADRLGIQFIPSNGWIDRFKNRTGMVYKTSPGFAQTSEALKAEEWKKTILPRLVWKYEPCDIFNVDEAGLFYNVLPNETRELKGKLCHRGEMSGERLTLLVGANMDGTEKLPLLVIGKTAESDLGKEKKLPCQYRSHKTAWMTADIFEGYIQALDARMAGKNRKILLFIDRCPAHPRNMPYLSNIRVEFIPAISQPMAYGVVKDLKTNFRRILVHKLLLNVGYNRDVAVKNFHVSLMNAMHYLATSWDQVSDAQIAKSFRLAGFYGNRRCEETDMMERSGADEGEDLKWRKIQELLEYRGRFEDFVGIDDSIVPYQLRTIEEICEEDRALSEAEEDAEEGEMKKRKPTYLTLEVKQQILREVDAGVKKADIARKYGISSSTLSTFIKFREKINRQRCTTLGLDDVDRMVYHWFVAMHLIGRPMTGRRLCHQAKSFASKLGISRFEATPKWFQSFTEKNHIKVKGGSGGIEYAVLELDRDIQDTSAGESSVFSDRLNDAVTGRVVPGEDEENDESASEENSSKAAVGDDDKANDTLNDDLNNSANESVTAQDSTTKENDDNDEIIFTPQNDPLGVIDQKQRRKQFSVEQKKQLIEEVRSGAKKADLSRKYGISPSTVSTIIKERERIEKFYRSTRSLYRKRIRAAGNEDVEAAVHHWFLDAKARNVPVNGPMLCRQARILAESFGIVGFKGSSGWLHRFRERHGLTVRRRAPRESAPERKTKDTSDCFDMDFVATNFVKPILSSPCAEKKASLRPGGKRKKRDDEWIYDDLVAEDSDAGKESDQDFQPELEWSEDEAMDDYAGYDFSHVGDVDSEAEADDDDNKSADSNDRTEVDGESDVMEKGSAENDDKINVHRKLGVKRKVTYEEVDNVDRVKVKKSNEKDEGEGFIMRNVRNGRNKIGRKKVVFAEECTDGMEVVRGKVATDKTVPEINRKTDVDENSAASDKYNEAGPTSGQLPEKDFSSVSDRCTRSRVGKNIGRKKSDKQFESPCKTIGVQVVCDVNKSERITSDAACNTESAKMQETDRYTLPGYQSLTDKIASREKFLQQNKYGMKDIKKRKRELEYSGNYPSSLTSSASAECKKKAKAHFLSFLEIQEREATPERVTEERNRMVDSEENAPEELEGEIKSEPAQDNWGSAADYTNFIVDVSEEEDETGDVDKKAENAYACPSLPETVLKLHQVRQFLVAQKNVPTDVFDSWSVVNKFLGRKIADLCTT